MKWSALAKALLPVVAIFVPAVAPLTPYIYKGIDEADAMPGASGADKQQHVLAIVANGAAAATATGHVSIDPNAAVAVTQQVFAGIDAVHAVVKANAAPVAPTASANDGSGV